MKTDDVYRVFPNQDQLQCGSSTGVLLVVYEHLV